jgi:hypothetical protein
LTVHSQQQALRAGLTTALVRRPDLVASLTSVVQASDSPSL